LFLRDAPHIKNSKKRPVFAKVQKSLRMRHVVVVPEFWWKVASLLAKCRKGKQGGRGEEREGQEMVQFSLYFVDSHLTWRNKIAEEDCENATELVGLNSIWLINRERLRHVKIGPRRAHIYVSI
jgi:hypothetical protein